MAEPDRSQDYAKAASTAVEEIPIIDLSHAQSDAGLIKVAEKLVTTAQSVGFFYVTGHGVPPELRADAFAAARRFFDLPSEQKATVTVNDVQRGWMAQGKTRLEGARTFDAKEVFFWGYEVGADDPDVLAGVPMVAPNQWPKDVAPWLAEAIQPYHRAVMALGHRLMSLIAVGLGQGPDLFVPFYRKPLARGQLVYYPPASDQDHAAQRMGAAAHTDFGVLTLLAQDDLGGLQVQNIKGDWIEAPPVPDSFVCNIGDLLQLWTGGTLRSTLHRVINRATVPRYSIPIFFDPSSQAEIDPALTGHPSSEPVITAGAHIAGRNRKNFTHYQKR